MATEEFKEAESVLKERREAVLAEMIRCGSAKYEQGGYRINRTEDLTAQKTTHTSLLGALDLVEVPAWIKEAILSAAQVEVTKRGHIAVFKLTTATGERE